ncbi:MAG: cupin domain-containing protein [Dehalococcoidales bacterium]|nr:cupin domain-containing protein [Dehalococcoidales bacterium]
MAKTEQEIHEVESIPWKPVEGYPGVYEKVLNEDRRAGSISRLLRYDPGTVFDEVLNHDFYEEIYVLAGTLIDEGKNLILKAGYYGYRHPGMRHGPYRSPDGMMTFEIRTYQG